MSEPATKDSQVSMRLPGELKARIERYAELTGRSKSYVAMEALADYLDWRLPQMQDLEEAIAAADRDEFASEAEVEAVFAHYGAGKAPAKAGAKPAARRTTAPATAKAPPPAARKRRGA